MIPIFMSRFAQWKLWTVTCATQFTVDRGPRNKDKHVFNALGSPHSGWPFQRVLQTCYKGKALQMLSKVMI